MTTRSLFQDVVQPDSLSLFSSTSSHPLALWSSHQDADLPEDSGICLVLDSTGHVAPSDPGITAEPFSLRSNDEAKGLSSDTVLHIQSPAVRNTFIRSPPDAATELGITLPYITFQFRTIGDARPFVFELGINDQHSRKGKIRISSFQVEPKLYLQQSQHADVDEQRDLEPLLHLPITPAVNSEYDRASLTCWQVLTLPLSQLAQQLSNTSLPTDQPEKLSSTILRFGRFHSISYIQVHANMRLRRVWCSQRLPSHDLAEFQVFS